MSVNDARDFPRSRSVSRRAFLRAMLLAGAAAAPSAALAQTGDGSGGPRYVLLTLLHTNDLHGRVWLPDQPQGLARIATLVRQIRREVPHVLLLDAGDIIHGTPHEKEFQGQPILSAMNALGYDAATAGNHEFDQGQDVLRRAIASARFPMLSANVVDGRTGQAWGGLTPYIIREKDGVRVAIFGLTTPTTVNIEWPRTLSGIRFADPVETARALVPRLRTEERADVVIALSHLGVVPDGLLAASVKGIDVILGGHSHTTLSEQRWVGNTLIMQTGAHARALGRVDMVVRREDNGRPGQISVINGRGGRWWGHNGVPAPLGGVYPRGPLLPVTEAVPEDPQVRLAYQPFVDRLRPYLEETLTTAAEPLPAADALKREIALGSLLADAARRHAKTDVAVVASNQMESKGLAAGPVRVQDLYALMGAYTRQHLVVARVPGARIREMLTRATEDGRVRVQVSGLRLAAGTITVGSEKLDDSRRYTIAGPAYVIQDYLLGRDGVEILEDDPLAPGVREAAVSYLRGHATLRNVTKGRLMLPSSGGSGPKP